VPTFASGLQRRVYFGAARLREWMQPDVWAQLEALPPGRFAEEHGFEFHGRHHEIYIGDPTRSKSEKPCTNAANVTLGGSDAAPTPGGVA
jgi:hypothetical protein